MPHIAWSRRKVWWEWRRSRQATDSRRRSAPWASGSRTRAGCRPSERHRYGFRGSLALRAASPGVGQARLEVEQLRRLALGAQIPIAGKRKQSARGAMTRWRNRRTNASRRAVDALGEGVGRSRDVGEARLVGSRSNPPVLWEKPESARWSGRGATRLLDGGGPRAARPSLRRPTIPPRFATREPVGGADGGCSAPCHPPTPRSRCRLEGPSRRWASRTPAVAMPPNGERGRRDGVVGFTTRRPIARKGCGGPGLSPRNAPAIAPKWPGTRIAN